MKAYGTAFALAVITACMGPPNARADNIDMSKLTCGELVKMNGDDVGIVFIWMHGYFGGLAKDTMLDVDSLPSAGKVLGEFCGENQKVTVMNAIKELSK